MVRSTCTSRGRRGTWRPPPSFCGASVAPMALGWLWARVTQNIVTHHLSHSSLSHATLSHSILSHTQLFHTQLCHTPFLTHNFVTHHLSHTTLSHTIFHTQLFTYIFLADRSSTTTSFVYPPFPGSLELFVSAYWTKLTCGVIRSFNFLGSGLHCFTVP